MVGSLSLFIIVLHHTEDTEETVAYGAEGFGFFLMLLAYLELDLLDGRSVPIGVVINKRGGIFY